MICALSLQFESPHGHRLSIGTDRTLSMAVVGKHVSCFRLRASRIRLVNENQDIFRVASVVHLCTAELVDAPSHSAPATLVALSITVL